MSTAIGVFRGTVKRALKVLKANGYITRVGSDKAERWGIKDYLI